MSTKSSRLPDIEDIEPLGAQDAPFLQEVREVFERHGMFERFGLTLLHDHFDIADDELLVETCDVENRVLTSSPQRIEAAEPGDHLVETNWQFAQEGGIVAGLVCRVGCFVDLKDRHKRTHQRVNNPGS